MTLLVGENMVVSIHYTLTDEEGAVIDSSEGAEPLKYLHGAGNIIPGLERALVGKTAGESLKVVVEPAFGYGDYQAELLQVVPRAAFEGVEVVEVGMAFTAQSPDGTHRRIVVRDVSGDEITVDANHELAGVDLHFEVAVIEVREASDDERSNGYAQ